MVMSTHGSLRYPMVPRNLLLMQLTVARRSAVDKEVSWSTLVQTIALRGDGRTDSLVRVPSRSNICISVICVVLLPELYCRDAIRAARRIANPGCFATSTQLLIAPLLPFLARPAWPSVFAISGYSGSGTVAGAQGVDGRPMTVPKISAESLNDGVRPYSLTDHIHEREAGVHLSDLLPSGADSMKVAFVPTVAPWFSGIISVLSMPLSEQLSARELRALYEKKYAEEKLVRLQKDIVEVKHV